MSKCPVLARLGLGHLPEEHPWLGAVGVAQDRVALVAVVQPVAERGRPEGHQGVQFVPVQGELLDVVAVHPAIRPSSSSDSWVHGTDDPNWPASLWLA